MPVRKPLEQFLREFPLDVKACFRRVDSSTGSQEEPHIKLYHQDELVAVTAEQANEPVKYLDSTAYATLTALLDKDEGLETDSIWDVLKISVPRGSWEGSLEYSMLYLHQLGVVDNLSGKWPGGIGAIGPEGDPVYKIKALDGYFVELGDIS